MKKLSNYRKSPIFNIRIRYNGELVQFNLGHELRIDPDIIDDNLKNHSGYYGFCLLLHKKLLARFEEKKHERKATYGRLFLKAKETKVMNNRPYSDDAAKAWAESHKDFLKVSQECITAREEADILFTCVRGLEQRKDLLQSLSSNIRSQK